jgi:2',3'-cyclic-nucleotide 2'-phosphodiesterase/3'-nucleotidase
MGRAGDSSLPRRYFFRTFAAAGVLLAAAGVSALAPQQTSRHVSLTLLSTTDLHGHIFPEDETTGSPANWGLAKIATLVRGVRGQHPNVLLLDCGDTIQGTPLAWYAIRQMGERQNPIISAMNEMGYAAMAVGNHEFNFGLGVLTKVWREAKFPLLAANLRPTTAGKNPAGIEPYAIRTIAGVRVAIVGFVTPGVVYWELPQNYAGYEFEGIVHAAERVIPEVRAKSDLVVVIMHSGLGRDPASGEAIAEDRVTGENAAGTLAATVPGIDVIFYGHTHLEMPEKIINGVLLAQAKNWGRSLAEADVELEQSVEGAWRVAAKTSRTIPVTAEMTADGQIAALAKSFKTATDAWLAKDVARSAVEQTTEFARSDEVSLLSLVHRTQLHAGDADVSLATIFNTRLRLAAGPVTVRDIFALYPYENSLFIVEMTGAQLKAALEHAASMFAGWPLAAGEKMRLPGYDYDTAEGVSYVIDLRQSTGQRIRELAYKGKPLAPEQKLRVAVNHYRYYGGGGYSVLHGLPIVYRSKTGVRELLIAYMTQHAVELPSDSVKSWRIEPREAYEAVRAEAEREAAQH